MSEKEKIEVQIFEEIENESGFSWKKLFNIIKLNAMYDQNKWN